MPISAEKRERIRALFGQPERISNRDIALIVGVGRDTVDRMRKEWEREHPPTYPPPVDQVEIDRAEMPREIKVSSLRANLLAYSYLRAEQRARIAADIAASPDSTAPERDAAWDGADRSMVAYLRAEHDHPLEAAQARYLLDVSGIRAYLGDWAKNADERVGLIDSGGDEAPEES